MQTSPTQLQVRDIMTAQPFSLESTNTVREIAQQMLEKDIRHMPIVKDKTLVGIISDRDIKEISFASSNLNTQLELQAEDILESYVLFVNPASTVREVIELMIDHKVGALPVVDEQSNHLVGIVSYIDVLRMVNESL